MKRTCLLFIYIQLLLLPVFLHAQKGATPKTLLWRISGNGLSKDSYLYGTMHLQDKRIFAFSDSLYHYLAKADGYAMEIDIRDLIDSVMQRKLLMGDDDDDDDKSVSGARKSAGDRSSVDSLIRRLRNDKDPESRRQLIKLRENLVRAAVSKGEMPTIMDAWLYNVAQRQGKWLGSVEDVQDQLGLVRNELGKELTEKDLKSSPQQVRVTLEKMIQVYLNKDLDKLYEISYSAFSEEDTDKLFIKRNIKMAHRMDSLSQIRSVFFAVGAAHLPGDMGVIKLLREKGYRVEPVLSSRTLDPEKYIAQLPPVPWKKVEDEEKTYWIEMPTDASTMSALNDQMHIRYSLDVSTMTFYMAASMEAGNSISEERMMEAITKNKKGEALSNKKIINGGLKGVEGDMRNSSAYVRIQFLYKPGRVYVLAAGGAKYSQLKNPEVARFFTTFKPRETPAVAPVTAWVTHTMANKGVSVEFPRKPKMNKSLEKKAEGTNWSFSIYDYVDVKNDVYFMLQVRDLKEALYLDGDSSFFTLFKGNISGVIDSITVDKMGTYQGFPAYYLDGYSEEKSVRYRTLNVARGNRVYSLLTGGADDDASKAIMDRFMTSLKLLPYASVPREQQNFSEGNFSTTATAPFHLYNDKKDEEESDVTATGQENNYLHYVSFDPLEVVSYEVVKWPMSKYFWAKNDSSFYAFYSKNYIGWNDSVLQKKPVENGSHPGMEWVVKQEGSHILKKLRILRNADTAYVIISFLPKHYINEKRHQGFFEDFRIIRDAKNSGDLYKNKAALLLKDLKSADSATGAKALDAMYNAPFEASDLPLLHKAYMEKYPDDTLDGYYTRRSRLQYAIESLKDKSTVDFVRKNYSKFKGDREPLKVEMLNMLMEIKTKESYALLKDLLINQTPAKTGDRILSSSMSDSLELALTLYPEVLKLSANNDFSKEIIRMTNTMLDTNLITLASIQPYTAGLYKSTGEVLSQLKAKDSASIYGYQERPRIDLLRRLKTKEAFDLLQQYTQLPEPGIRLYSAMTLLHNNQEVSPAVFQQLAASVYYRRDLYDSLSDNGWLRFFPEQYATQLALAESDIYNAAADDEMPQLLELVAEKQWLYKGELKKFYLFKVIYESGLDEDGEEEEEGTAYLGIAGPYSLNGKDLSRHKNITGLFTTEAFDAGKIEELFQAYLDEIASYESDDE